MLWSTQPVFASELGDCGSFTSQASVTSLVYQPLRPSGSVGVRVASMVGAVGSMMLYVSEALTVRPPASVYEHEAVWRPIPSAALSPLTALNVAAKDELPSSASVTWHVAAGTDPLS